MISRKCRLYCGFMCIPSKAEPVVVWFLDYGPFLSKVPVCLWKFAGSWRLEEHEHEKKFEVVASGQGGLHRSARVSGLWVMRMSRRWNYHSLSLYPGDDKSNLGAHPKGSNCLVCCSDQWLHLTIAVLNRLWYEVSMHLRSHHSHKLVLKAAHHLRLWLAWLTHCSCLSREWNWAVFDRPKGYRTS